MLLKEITKVLLPVILQETASGTDKLEIGLFVGKDS
jgi:hypothetical protein